MRLIKDTVLEKKKIRIFMTDFVLDAKWRLVKKLKMQFCKSNDLGPLPKIISPVMNQTLMTVSVAPSFP